MSAQVDYHLARARVVASGPIGTDSCLVSPCVDAVVRTMSRVFEERAIDISSAVPPDLTARVRVAPDATRADTGLVVTVDDDGHGLPPNVRQAVLERGVRLDEAAPGSGLGLSIVRDLTEHYGGLVRLSGSALGGLRVEIALPPAAAAD